MQKITFTIILTLLSVMMYGQSKYTISGYITDRSSGEGLIAANIVDLRTGKGTVTNTYGFYSLTIPGDSLAIGISYIGYQTQVIPLDLQKDLTMDISLSDETTLQAVEIVAERSEKIEEKSEMSTIRIPVSQLKKLPSLLGEADILKAIQLLPGVQSGGEGQSGFYVRGGSQDQNLILLDGSPVYNASHLFGFFSVFNADAIKDVTLIKGGFPARYGGRLSSVLDISMKEGNMKEFHGSGTVGLIASKFTFEGPIVKDKAAFIISGRRTYIDVLARPLIAYSLSQEGGSGAFGYYFYDLNAKINWKISSKDRIYLSAYLGDDQFYARINQEDTFTGDTGQVFKSIEKLKFGFGWGNITSTLRWNHLWTDKLFSNTSLTYSKYNFGTDNGFGSEQLVDDVSFASEDISFGYNSGIEDFTAKIDFDYIPLPNHFIRFGANVTNHNFTPGANNIKFRSVENTQVTLDIDTIFGQDNVSAFENYIYVEDDIDITSKLKMNVGLHFSSFSVRRDSINIPESPTFTEKNQVYTSLQPRISMRYLLPRSVSLKASYSSMQQYIQFLSNENIGLPWDQWLPTTENVEPQTSWQAAIGAAKTIRNDYEVSVEAYYKEMKNVTAYTEGASVFSFDSWQNQVTQGDGRSYGLEVFIQKKTGKLSGWIGYTLSWSERRFDDKNFGEWYPFKFDRRHDIAVVGVYEHSEHINLSATWVYGTGNTFTFPTSQYYLINQYPWNPGEEEPINVNDLSERNNYRLAPYHRADINVDLLWGKKRFKNKLSIGAYNIYNRKNPFFLNPETKTEFNPQTNSFESTNVLVQYSLFRLIPSIAYSFTF